MEEWKIINRFPNYEAGSEGDIRNAKTKRVLKKQVGTRGYEKVTVYKDNKPHDKRVHRLIAEAFYGEHDSLDVDHINGNKLDNRVENLEWCTRKENARRAFEIGLREAPRKIRIRVIETGEVYDSIRECERYTDCAQSEICKYFKGERPHVKGYHFEKI